MKLQLDNLIYTTDDVLYIERLEELGAIRLDSNDEDVKEEKTKSDEIDYSDMKVEDIKHLLKEKGIDFDNKTKKEDLIKLLGA